MSVKKTSAFCFRLLYLLIIIGLSLRLAACGNQSNSAAAPTLLGVQVTLENDTLVTGLKSRAYAAALYSDNTSLDLSNQASWFSFDSTVATIDADGVITALQPGTTVISAVLQDKVASAQLTVNAAQLISLEINPTAVLLAQGQQQQFTAKGIFTSSEAILSYDVTDQVSWSSADTNKLTISDVAGSKGLATALAAGTVNVSATLNNVTDTVPTTISTASLSRIELSAAQTSIPLGNQLQLHATGILSDNSEIDLTDHVSWSSSNNNLATINDAGLVTALAAGTVEFTLSYQGLSATLEITISDASLTRIEISPSNPVLSVGETIQLYATAIYSNGSIVDVTDQTTWASSNTNVASIGITSYNRGQVNSIVAGITTIYASFHNQSQQISLSVSTATLLGIEIVPSNPSIAVGTQQGFTVTGHYDDGSTRDLTEQVSWSSGDNAIAEELADSNYFKGLANGSTQIVAAINNISAFTDLTVTAATLNSISLSPIDLTIAKGYNTQFSATGHFSDSSTQDISRSVVWQSNDETVARISNNSDNKGMLTAITSGTTSISASFGAVSESTNVTVGEAQLDSISIQLNDNQMIVGTQQTLTAIGQFSDGNNLDISANVVWSSSADDLASVGNGINDGGHVNALGAGNVTMTASMNGISGNAALVITDDPDSPVSLSIFAAPNMILNDGTDSTTISITVRPAGESGTIADNTPINIEITEGATISSMVVYTSGGDASFNFSSTYAGFIKIQATIASSSISDSGYIYATGNFVNVIAAIGYKYVQYDGNILKSDSWFAMLVENISNRNFTIDQYQFSNGGSSELYAGQDISDGDLSSAESYGLVVVLSNDQIDNGISSVLTLTDPATAQQFSINATFTTP